ncbi:MAG: MoaD/ThiS family protein [Promethearchaeota archaeon]
MTISVKLFGDLRKKANTKINGPASVKLNIDENGIDYISDLLKKLAIGEDEVSHIFVNSIYSGPRKKVKKGDKVSLFPIRMSLLYKWYFVKEEDD